MASTRTMMYALACAVVLTAPAIAQQPPVRVDVERLGPQVGAQVADFRLPDAQGAIRTRDSIMGPKGAMLVFSRSLDWCPYCKTQAAELQGRLAELNAQGLGVAVVTYDSPAVLADFAKRRGITFPLLSDSGSATIKRYGILNTTVAENAANYGIPFPGTFILDRRGVVTSRFFEDAYQERTTVSTLLLSLGQGRKPAAASRITTDHLDITTYTSDEVVAPGTLFSLVFDIVPSSRIHVYAPGAKDYRVITFTPTANPLLVARPMEYPKSDIYHFVPLDERVPVFQKPFQLRQRMAVTAAQDKRATLASMETMTISGTLEYQACDDRLCFNPQSVPVAVSVRLRQLDTERATVAK
jgi:peroxiredoxin